MNFLKQYLIFELPLVCCNFSVIAFVIMMPILFSHVYVLFVQSVVAYSPYKTLLPKDLLATVHTPPLKTPVFPSLSPLCLCVSLVCFCGFAVCCVST